MTREERCQEAVKKGYTYDAETGLVKNKHGKVLKTKFYSGYKRFYVTINYKRYVIRQHQFGWYFIHGYFPEEIDHINGIRDDNRLCNLRSVTKQQNAWNRHNHKGYHFKKSKNKFEAVIKINYKRIYLGRYNTAEEARAAYLQAKEKYHKI